jgi:peptide/nickel transport system ATP-binding protein
MTVIELSNVTKFFPRETGFSALFARDRTFVKAVNGVNLTIDEGQIMGLVGESGCGKTTLGKLLLRIHDLTDGEVYLHGKPLEAYGDKELYKEIQMVFQDPFKSLNPRMKIADQLKEPLRVHDIANKDEKIREALEFAQLTPPEKYLNRYPHELSGGEKQRVSIASALVLDPSLIVTDEPVSMLDVSIRAGVLDLLQDLAVEKDVSILYISHDISTVKHICDEMAVMYLGKIVEQGKTKSITTDPLHPYTRKLINATPTPNPSDERDKVVRDDQIPDPIDLPSGCYFKDRCPYAVEACDEEDMSLRHPSTSPGRQVACHRAVKEDITWNEEDIITHLEK